MGSAMSNPLRRKHRRHARPSQSDNDHNREMAGVSVEAALCRVIDDLRGQSPRYEPDVFFYRGRKFTREANGYVWEVMQ